jgi:hypothetical protein
VRALCRRLQGKMGGTANLGARDLGQSPAEAIPRWLNLSVGNVEIGIDGISRNVACLGLSNGRIIKMHIQVAQEQRLKPYRSSVLPLTTLPQPGRNRVQHEGWTINYERYEPISRQCFSIRRLKATFSPMSVQLGVMREILHRSPLVARILPPVDVLPMLTMMILNALAICVYDGSSFAYSVAR